jgi:hypothetical protein
VEAVSVPTGRKRVVLIGGKRHGQWCDVPEGLPYEWRVLHPPEPVRLEDRMPETHPAALSGYDQYYRGTVVGVGSDQRQVTVYVTSVGSPSWELVASGMHLAYCDRQPWSCGRPEWHGGELVW